jgi:hypothetical protein
MRCDVGRASGHVTIKPSICKRPAFYKSSVYAVNVSCLTPGDLPGVEGATEGRETAPDRSAEVSSGHSRLVLTTEGPNNRGM